jgi:hypothetical protein
MGVSMALRRRPELLDWARESDAWIIEDDFQRRTTVRVRMGRICWYRPAHLEPRAENSRVSGSILSLATIKSVALIGGGARD